MAQHVTYLNVKALGSGDDRIVEGWASTPREDRVGDVVVPDGARYELPLPLLFAHKHDEPIGSVISATVTKAGIRIRAKLTKGVARAEEVWKLIQDGALTAVSVGFQALKSTPMSNGGLRYDEWSWRELSIVSVPANPDAKIAVGKGIAYSSQPKAIRVTPRTDPPAKPKRSILGDAAEFATRTKHDEWAGPCAAFDAAVECLPLEMRCKADLARSSWDRKACQMTLTDSIGRTFAVVKDDGTVCAPEEANSAEAPKPAAPQGLTRAQVAQVRRMLDEVVEGVGHGIGTVVAEESERLSERMERLEQSALHDGGIFAEGKEYRKGAVVVNDGQTWLATDNTEATPGRGAQGWRLLAKKTRDAA